MILPFNKISKNDAHKAGGKWASLGEMIQSGIPVPDWFVILAEVFETFIDFNGIRSEIGTILKELNHQSVDSIERASEKVQELIVSWEIPTEIRQEITKFHKKLGARFCAVRSSATAEDGTEHAWAGQLDTYLNVSKNDIEKKIQSCWASLFTPRALFYRSEKWLRDIHISVAVVVQKMVDAECAGVAFSVHPVTENHDEIVIEGSWWLWEAVVSGEVTPDSFVISKSSGEILSRSIAEKKKGIFRNKNGQNEWLEIEKKKQGETILSDKELQKLSELVTKIENHYWFPCDIEWAFAKNKIYILQARPITTLSKNKFSTIDYGILSTLKNAVFQLDWTGVFSLFHCSIALRGYFIPLKVIFGRGFSWVYVSYVWNVAHAYLHTNEYQELGIHLVSLAHDQIFRNKWIENSSKLPMLFMILFLI